MWAFSCAETRTSALSCLLSHENWNTSSPGSLALVTFGLKLHCRLSSVSSLLIYPADPGTGQPPQSREPITQATFFYVYDVYVHMYPSPHCFCFSGEPTTLYTNIPYSSPWACPFIRLLQNDQGMLSLPLLSVSQPSLLVKWAESGTGVGWRAQ